MHRVSKRSAAILALLVAVPLAGAAVEDDAGSGGDAPDAPDLAYPVGHGTFGGYLGNDRDWYRLGAASASATCLEVVAAGGDADSDLELRVGGITLSGDGNGGADAVLAVGSVDAALLGVKPTSNPATNTPSRPGTYVLATAARGLGDLGVGDAGTGGDVGDDFAGAHALTDACVAGDVRPGLDVRDVYALTGAIGSVVHLSFVQATPDGVAYLRLVDPSGIVVAQAFDGEAKTVTLARDGTHHLLVSIPGSDGSLPELVAPRSTHGTDNPVEQVKYMLATEIDDPGQGCRPQCF